MPTAAHNAADLERELGWLSAVLDRRFEQYFRRAAHPGDALEIEPPELSGSEYARLLARCELGTLERLALILAMTAHLRPHLLDVFSVRNQTFDRPFTEFGGLRAGDEFRPTGETVAFVAGGIDLHRRFEVRRVLSPDGALFTRDLLVPTADPSGTEDPMKAPLQVTPEVLERVTTGRTPPAVLGPSFPAQRIRTALEWDDLVLHPVTRAQVEEIHAWIEHGPTLMHTWGMSRKLRPGYRALFHGPPGTGKTMTASLLGKSTGREVHRIDLSLVVSKYVGETSKNLARVLDRAEARGWILFFDEADALFGSRTETQDARDRYANQEVSFLLQRIETFDGIAILASNLRDNLDPAFRRRFESVVYFPLPRPAEQLRIWQQGFPAGARLDTDLCLEAVVREHPLSGGSIMNVIRFVTLRSLAESQRPVTARDIREGIRRELAKEGRAP